MKATDTLMEEHRVIERVLASLEKATARMEAGAPVRPGFFMDAAQFVRGFADGCHHKKEEGVLFAAMVRHGMPGQSGPIAAMLADHADGRQYTRDLDSAARRLESGDETARQAVIDNARLYTQLLRMHIHKEDSILFPLANEVIPPRQQDDVADDFERVEHEDTGAGVHEKYLALAASLEEESRRL